VANPKTGLNLVPNLAKPRNEVSRKFITNSNKTNMKSIVQHLREEKNLTQTELAEKVVFR
jgi:hypothetical protein